jgi:macrolide-specific efflux system membrane fusion protein
MVNVVLSAIALATAASFIGAQVNDGAAAGAKTADSAAELRFKGKTQPSKLHQYSLRVADVVREVKVMPGDHVTKGQVLIQEDDREEQLNYLILKAEADSDVAVRYAKTTWENRKVDYARTLELFNNGLVASKSEFDKAKLDMDQAALEIEKATHEREQNQRKADREKQTLERMKIVSEFDGVVKEILVKEGEVVDPQKPAIVVVKNDPLWVEVFIPSATSLTLQKDQYLDVTYEGDQKAQRAKIIFLDPVVDSTSNKQFVRLEMPNPTGKPSGLWVWVQQLPAGKVAEAGRK